MTLSSMKSNRTRMQYRMVEKEKGPRDEGWERGDAEGKHSKRSGKKRIDDSIKMKEARKKKKKKKRKKDISSTREYIAVVQSRATSSDRKWGPRDSAVKEMRMPLRMIPRLIANGFRQHAAPLNSRVKWITRSDSRPRGTYRSAEMENYGEGIFQDFVKSKSFPRDSVLELCARRVKIASLKIFKLL